MLITSAEIWGLSWKMTSIICDSPVMAEAKCLTTGQGVNEYGVLE